MILAHISDLHFAVPTLNPLQLLSKRWVGNLNLIFSRKKLFQQTHFPSLIEYFKKSKVDLVIISGDLTTTSRVDEFKKASHFVKLIEKAGIKTFVIPGNHDHYTKKAFKDKRFYHFFPSPISLKEHPFSHLNLKDHGIVVFPLQNKWSIIALDTTLATPLFSSKGHFSSSLEKQLEEVLSQMPSEENLILVNHYPFFEHESPRITLDRGKALREMLKRFSQVKIYLHGHTHRQCLADLRSNHFPIILDSGSTAHKDKSSWNLIKLQETGCSINPYRWDQQINSWQTPNLEAFACSW